MRKRRIDRLAKAFPSAELRAAADAALERELRSVEPEPFSNLPCDGCIR
jgi:hypothetical protein